MANILPAPAGLNLAEEVGGCLRCLYLVWGRQSACKFFSPALSIKHNNVSPILPECVHVRFAPFRKPTSGWTGYPLCTSREAWVDAMTWKRGRGGRRSEKTTRKAFQHFWHHSQTTNKRGI